MSRLGLVLCAIYAAIILVCVAISLSADGDPKGQFVFMQLPIAMQAGLVQTLGFGSALASLSWPAAYALLGLPVFALLYGVGWLLSRALALAGGARRR